MSQVLLINPYIHDIAAYDLWNKPIGLLYVASILQKNGITTYLIDLLDRYDPFFDNVKNKWGNTGKYNSEKIQNECLTDILNKTNSSLKRYGLPVQEFKNRLQKIEKVDAVLITTAMTYWYLGVYETIGIVRDHFKCPIYIGGNPVILDPNTYGSKNNIDHVYENMQVFYERIEKDLRVELKYKPKDHIEFPIPAWEFYENKNTAVIQTSWGCPFKCTYCASGKIYPEFIQRDPGDVVDELEKLAELGFSDIAIYDDALLVNCAEHINIILSKWIEKGKKMNFHLPNAIHSHLLTDRTSALFYGSGFKTIAIGHDTKSIRIKQNRIYDLSGCIKILKASGFKKENIWVYLLLGLNGQGMDEIMEELHAIAELDALIKPAWFSPIPGTADFDNGNPPFFYNNSVYPVLSGNLSADNIKHIKEKIKQLNGRDHVEYN